MSDRNIRIILSALALVMLVFTLPFSAQADSGEDAFTQTVNGYQVALIFAEDPALGENQIHVQIHDATDLPVSDATVEVSLALAEEENHVVAEEPSGHDSVPGMDEHSSEASGHDEMPGGSESANAHGAATHDEIQSVQLAPSHHEEGEYAGEIHIESTGDWILIVHFTLEGETMEVGFPVLLKNSSRNVILAGFLSVNILIVIVAGFLKKPKIASASL